LIGGILAAGYALISWLNKAPEQVSQVNLDRVGGAVPGKISETAAYREQLDESNRKGAMQAQAENKTYIASLQLEQQPIVPAATKKTPDNPTIFTQRIQRADVQVKSKGLEVVQLITSGAN